MAQYHTFYEILERDARLPLPQRHSTTAALCILIAAVLSSPLRSICRKRVCIATRISFIFSPSLFHFTDGRQSTLRQRPLSSSGSPSNPSRGTSRTFAPPPAGPEERLPTQRRRRFRACALCCGRAPVGVRPRSTSSSVGCARVCVCVCVACGSDGWCCERDSPRVVGLCFPLSVFVAFILPVCVCVCVTHVRRCSSPR